MSGLPSFLINKDLLFYNYGTKNYNLNSDITLFPYQFVQPMYIIDSQLIDQNDPKVPFRIIFNLSEQILNQNNQNIKINLITDNGKITPEPLLATIDYRVQFNIIDLTTNKSYTSNVSIDPPNQNVNQILIYPFYIPNYISKFNINGIDYTVNINKIGDGSIQGTIRFTPPSQPLTINPYVQPVISGNTYVYTLNYINGQSYNISSNVDKIEFFLVGGGGCPNTFGSVGGGGGDVKYYVFSGLKNKKFVAIVGSGGINYNRDGSYTTIEGDLYLIAEGGKANGNCQSKKPGNNFTDSYTNSYGGGASTISNGINASYNKSGMGANGIISNITGSNVYYGGGGGGSFISTIYSSNDSAIGGLGGGGNGGVSTNTKKINPTNGVNGLGGGGGGGVNGISGFGGHGVIILKVTV
jgi:hypothetical protein